MYFISLTDNKQLVIKYKKVFLTFFKIMLAFLAILSQIKLELALLFIISC
jgi:hypothetical protein